MTVIADSTNGQLELGASCESISNGYAEKVSISFTGSNDCSTVGPYSIKSLGSAPGSFLPAQIAAAIPGQQALIEVIAFAGVVPAAIQISLLSKQFNLDCVKNGTTSHLTYCDEGTKKSSSMVISNRLIFFNIIVFQVE